MGEPKRTLNMFDKNLCIKNVFAGVFITLISALCFGQEPNDPNYREQLKRSLRECHRWRYKYSGLQQRHLGVIHAIDDPNAIPFLLGVMTNEPQWVRESDRHLARCYATMCLGATEDSAALEPLVEALRTVEEKDREYGRYLASYAASALALLDDPNAVDPLIEALDDEWFPVRGMAVWSLSELQDFRAIHPILEELKNQEDTRIRTDYGKAVAKIARMKVPHEKLSDRRYWTDWWEKKPKFTQERLDAIHSEWKNMNKKTEGEKRIAQRKLNETADLGIPALPLMVEKVREGESQFIPLISRLTDDELNKTATQAECLDWWENNKDKWVIPFPDANESATDPNATG